MNNFGLPPIASALLGLLVVFTSFIPKTAKEARESRESPRMGGTSSKRKLAAFFRGNFPHLPPYIRVHWFYSRAKTVVLIPYGLALLGGFGGLHLSDSDPKNRPDSKLVNGARIWELEFSARGPGATLQLPC